MNVPPVELEKIAQVLLSFEKLCGLKLTVYDLGALFTADNQSLLPAEMTLHTHDFCQGIKTFSIQRCYSSCKYNVLQKYQTSKDIYIKTCHADVKEICIPVFSADKLCCIAFMGPFVESGRVHGVSKLSAPEVQDALNTAIVLQSFLQRLAVQSLSTLHKNLGKRASEILEFINDNYTRAIGIAELAEVIGLSESRTIHLVREVTGKSFVEILTEKRIEQSLKLLENSSRTVATIAAEAGFSSSSYFCTVFRKKLGMTPAEYRKKMI